MRSTRGWVLVVLLGGIAAVAQAQDMGKLLATGGVSSVEGAGGGGLTPWALITGYGSNRSMGANLHYTFVKTQDYQLDTYGVAAGLFDRVELSAAKQTFKGEKGLLSTLRLQQDIYGIKVRIAGDAVYDQDSIFPQIAIGAQHKRNDDVGGLGALGIRSVKQLGAKSDSGTDYYVSATKVLLGQSLLLNGTVRFTSANQFGLLGFGNASGDSRRAQAEGSVAYLFSRKFVAGAEFRQKPSNLSTGLDREKYAYDVFAAWFPTRNVSLTAAYVSLGDIAGGPLLGANNNTTRQHGAYLSVQVGF